MDKIELRELLMSLHLASFQWAVVCCRGDRELAEEVLQSVYVSLLGKEQQTFAQRSSFKTWLFAVIRNKAADHARGDWWARVMRLELGKLVQIVDGTSTSHEELAGDEESSVVRAALSKLPLRQRELVHLVFYEGLTVAQAALVMQVSIGSARQHYARAKTNLKNTLTHMNQLEPEKKIEIDARPL